MNAVEQARALEKRAQQALIDARAARAAAERVERQRKHEARSVWIAKQIAAAKPDPGDKSVRETITIRSTYGIAPRPILWDVLTDTGERNRYGLPNRQTADRVARELRARGRAVRVVQAAV